MPNTPADMPSGLTIFAIGFVIMLMFVLLLWGMNTLPQKLREIMSRPPVQPAQKTAEQVVHVPVPLTSTNAEPAAAEKVVPTETDAPNGGTGWEMPRISRTLSDRDIIITLAVQRAGGKYRLSANKIHDLMGGPRADVLALVKQVREGPAEYRPLTPDQQATRQALGLEG